MATINVSADAKRAKQINQSVVTIQGRECRRRKNRPEDAKTIQLRRLISTSEAVAFGEENAIALAIAWAMQDKLPRNNLRLVAGTLDARKDFRLRLAEVEITRAEKDAFSAKIDRERLLSGDEAANAMRSESERLFDCYRQAVSDLAETAAHTRLELQWKKTAIGTVWLRAEGEWYDRLRSAVARDEERLARR